MESKEITEDTLNKAFEVIQKASELTASPEKQEEVVEKGYSSEKMQKACDSYKDSDDMEKAMLEDGYSEKFVSAVKEFKSKDKEDGGELTKKEASVDDKEIKKGFEDLENLIKGSSNEIGAKFSALGDIYKAQDEKIDALTKSLQENEDFISDLKNRLGKVESQPNLRKSVQTQQFVERFAKSEDGKEVYNIKDKNSRSALKAKLMDASNIEKGEGYDRGLASMAQTLELTKSLSPQEIQKLSAMNIEVQV